MNTRDAQRTRCREVITSETVCHENQGEEDRIRKNRGREPLSDPECRYIYTTWVEIICRREMYSKCSNNKVPTSKFNNHS